MFDHHFDPSKQEQQIYKMWEDAGVFKPSDEGEPFSIMIPPPNVTGSLHIGHALNNTLQDVLCRFERMRGKSVLWQAGTDHAGIATQLLVERKLAKDNQPSKNELGRDEFVRRVWEWKEESGNIILNQLRRLGATCDWSRTRFTMDEGLSEAVRLVFVRLFREGLIYRDKRLVNWDPHLQTAISDLETVPKEVDGFIWHIAYPIVGEENRSIVVATTRPETLLGDTAVAVHPEDDRYRDLIGKKVLVPFVEREIPIIADTHANPETGSGAVKITPAHDFNDFEVGKRHNLEQINVLANDGSINEVAPKFLQGLDRYAAREIIIEKLQESGQLIRTEQHKNAVPFSDRSGVAIEPMITEQWYCETKAMAETSMRAVTEGRTQILPQNWQKNYFDWLENIQPWCISRQLWWGHRIPIWYGPDGKPFAAIDENEAHELAKIHYGKSVALYQDEDVLDTWFSSALWAFSTLGWPQQTNELKKFYPTSVLITGFDILFFWVARMMMFSTHFMSDIPFKKVYLHALVRDEFGKKMSKSKGNIIDPLVMIDKYGADGLRLALVAMAAQGRDILLSEKSVAGYRNFATKLWNAARLANLNKVTLVDKLDKTPEGEFNFWIVSETNKTIEAITAALDDFRFNDAGTILYRFVWNVFCDWYLEIAKLDWKNGEGENVSAEAANAANESRMVCGWVLNQILRLSSPIIPYVSEAIWQEMHGNDSMLAKQSWAKQFTFADEFSSSKNNKLEEAETIMDCVRSIRSARAAVRIPPSTKLILEVQSDTGSKLASYALKHKNVLQRLANLSDVVDCKDFSTQRLRIATQAGEAALPLIGQVDVEAELIRLAKLIESKSAEYSKIKKRVDNAGFVAKAPSHIVEEHNTHLKMLIQEIDAIKNTCSLLKNN